MIIDHLAWQAGRYIYMYVPGYMLPTLVSAYICMEHDPVAKFTVRYVMGRAMVPCSCPGSQVLKPTNHNRNCTYIRSVLNGLLLGFDYLSLSSLLHKHNTKEVHTCLHRRRRSDEIKI